MNNIDISRGRLISLDAFRGFTIVAMILSGFYQYFWSQKPICTNKI